jgi:hypothetical protein
VLDAFIASRRNHLYVVDGKASFLGAVNLHDVNDALRAGDPGTLTARDLARPRFEVTVPEEGLPRVLDRFASQECERLPVLADLESRARGDDLEAGHPSVYRSSLGAARAASRPPRPRRPQWTWRVAERLPATRGYHRHGSDLVFARHRRPRS